MRRPATRLRVVVLVAALVASAALVGCDGGSSAAVLEPRMTVEYAGCFGARRGPVCKQSENSTLTLWIGGAAEDWLLEVDRAEVALPLLMPVQGGSRLELNLPAGAREVTVRRVEGGASWNLTLEAPPAISWQVRVKKLVQAREFEQAAGELRRVLDQLENPAQRGWALALLGQLDLQRGETAAGRDLLRQSLPLLRAGGDLQVEFDKTTVLIFAMIVRDHDFTEARERLTALPRDWQAPGEVRYFDSFYRGLLAMYQGDARRALEHLEKAVSSAQRTGTSWHRRAAEELIAVQLQRIGRHGEAEAALTSLRAQAVADEDPCREAGVLANLGLNALLARQAGIAAGDPEGWLHQALRTLEDACDDDLPERQNVLLSIALAEVDANRPTAAREALDRAAAVAIEPGLRLLLWWREIEGRVALAEHQPAAALRIFGSLRQAADAALAPEVQWRAQVGMGLAHRALGDLEGAVEAFRSADRLLDAALLLVPLQEGRESFLAQREKATAHHLEILLELGRVDQALTLARRARIRLLRHLNRPIRWRGLDPQQKRLWESLVADFQKERALIDRIAAEDWQLAIDELEVIGRKRATRRRQLTKTLDAALAALEPESSAGTVSLPPLRSSAGTLTLVLQPLVEDWVVFAHREGVSHANRIRCGQDQPQALASCLLSSAHRWIRDSSEMRILATSELAEVDFEALPFDGEALLARTTIVYDLDLGPPPMGHLGRSGAAAVGHPESALILFDPSGDLPRARQEAEAVRDLLQRSSQVAVLGGRDASAAAVNTALPSAELFHFAGHARFAGRSGWQTYLPLAGGGRLTLEDVLLLERPPRWVVLSGCDTARSAGEGSTAQRIGLAQAFLAAGSTTVIAAVRPVDDWLAADLVAEFYPAWLAGATLSAALRQAQLTLRQRRPEADWSSFRVLER